MDNNQPPNQPNPPLSEAEQRIEQVLHVADQFTLLEVEEPGDNDLTEKGKRLKDLTDAELQEWYNQVRQVTSSPQSLKAHLAARETKKGKAEPKHDISEYI